MAKSWDTNSPEIWQEKLEWSTKPKEEQEHEVCQLILRLWYFWEATANSGSRFSSWNGENRKAEWHVGKK